MSTSQPSLAPIDSMARWLRSKKPEITSIDPDDNLLEKGLLDSLQFVNFLFFVEQVRGAPIPPEQVVPKNFSTLRSIERAFFGAS